MPFEHLSRARFQSVVDGLPTDLFTMRNGRGMVVRFTSFGAKIEQVLVPDRSGELDDVALGYDDLEGVRAGQPSMGAFVGRYAGRIAQARFTLDGVTHQLGVNAGPHSLHGGVKGSRHRVFAVTQRDEATCDLVLDYADGEEGFPGKVRSRITYQVTEENELDIRYEAETDAPTVVNFTSHSFWNLAGHDRLGPESMAAHVLRLPASAFIPSDAERPATGEIRDVTGTPLDFRTPTAIGARAGDPYLGAFGYDHCWVVDKAPGAYDVAAVLYEPTSGREMTVLSTEPGLVFVGGSVLTGQAPRDVGKQGKVYAARSGICLDPGKYPDTPNQPHFPSAVVRPGEVFRGRITYRFATR